MSQKVVAIAAGEAHTLALTGDGSVFSWGRGTFGRLGTGKELDELVPVPVEFGEVYCMKQQSSSPEIGELTRPKFVGIAAGAYHSLALEDDGSVWSWGYNIYGQLGCGEENSLVPCLIERFQELGSPDSLTGEPNSNSAATPLKIISVKAGGMTSFAIDNLGSLWMWGNCPAQSSDTGQFCIINRASPLPVWEFHGRTVVKVACGNEHVIAAVSPGETLTPGETLICYSWGNNTHGQLGLGHKDPQPCPVLIPTFNLESSWEVYEIACGAYHSAVLTHKKSYGDEEIQSKCWTFGLGENGQLGHRTTASSAVPVPVIGLPSDGFLISLDCGLFHTSVVSSDGEVWCWGMEGGLGLCTGFDAGDALSPVRVRSPESNGFGFLGPVQVACGAAHTVLVAGDGYRMWAWGRGRSGVLGNGQINDSFAPCVVTWPPIKAEQLKELELGSSSTSISTNNNSNNKLMEEMEVMRSRLELMERYANILHISIFRKPLEEKRVKELFEGSAVFDIRREFEGLLESADLDELARMEMFYRSMLSSVKNKEMERRVQEMVRKCFVSMSMGRQY